MIASHRSGGLPESGTGEAETAPRSPSASSAAAPEHTKLYPEIATVSDVAGNDGVWYVLDAATPTVHMLDADGAWLGTFGREGAGPGELLSPVAVAAGGDAVAVADERRHRVHVYAPEGTYRDSRRIEAPGCAVARPVDIAAWETTFFVLVECLSLEGPAAVPSVEHQVVALGDGPQRPLARRRQDAGTMDLGAAYVLSEHPRGFVFGAAQDNCLGIYDPGGRQLLRACHEWLDRMPFPADWRREQAAVFRRRSSLLSVRIPDNVPPFDRVFANGQRLVYRAFKDEELYELRAEGREDEPQSLGVPAAPWLFVADGIAVAAWDELEGVRIALHRLPWS